MAPTEGRVAKPERRWGCRRGTPWKPKGVPKHRTARTTLKYGAASCSEYTPGNDHAGFNWISRKPIKTSRGWTADKRVKRYPPFTSTLGAARAVRCLATSETEWN